MATGCGNVKPLHRLEKTGWLDLLISHWGYPEDPREVMDPVLPLKVLLGRCKSSVKAEVLARNVIELSERQEV